ncbi:coiled-coil domain-containing protein 122 [Danio rerio]|uniref:Coiled-coil domain-containing protein 122 n=1 Tax=Danio rerio TaxID=7955 RepID=A0A8M9PNE5_DANRE
MDSLSQQDFPLKDALQELLQQGEARAQQISNAQRALHTLQDSLEVMERSRESVCSQVRLKQKMLTALHCDAETLQCSIMQLQVQTQSAAMQNLQLRAQMQDQQEQRRSQLQEFSSYRSRLQAFRCAVSPQQSPAHVCEELQMKMQEIRRLTHTLEEMKRQHADSRSGLHTQEDIEFLKTRINEARQTMKDSRAHLDNEKHTHTQLRREIEIQRRRCEAIQKRLRCQLKKTQSSQRRLRSDVTHMQKQLEELRRLEER